MMDLRELLSKGERAGYAFRDKEQGGIKASAKDGYIWWLGDIAERLFPQMENKDGYLVFIPKADYQSVLTGKD